MFDERIKTRNEKQEDQKEMVEREGIFQRRALSMLWILFFISRFYENENLELGGFKTNFRGD
jgi:hypothetical protein